MLTLKYCVPAVFCLLSVNVSAQTTGEFIDPNHPFNAQLTATAQDQGYPYSPLPTEAYPFNPKTRSYYSYSNGFSPDVMYLPPHASCHCLPY